MTQRSPIRRVTWAIFAAAVAAFAQAPQFEVATIKPSANGARPGVQFQSGHVHIRNANLRLIIAFSYKVRENQVLGAPSWLDSDRFDIEAKAEGPAGSDAMLLMLQSLMEERFRLKLHRETKEGPVYLLTVAKGGLRMKPAANCVPYDPNNLPRPTAAGETPVNYCGRTHGDRKGMLRTFDAAGYGMVDGAGPAGVSVTGMLSGFLERTVIDKTGLTGLYDFHLEWTPNDSPAAQADDAGPSIFTAVEEQLGLKLEPARGPVEYLAIDNVEKPSEN